MWRVKDNQPTLLETCARTLDDLAGAPAAKQTRHGWETAGVVTKGHGRREERTVERCVVPRGWHGWPGLRLIYRVQSRRTVQGATTTETRYGISNGQPAAWPARRLLEVSRSHWGIENGLHYVRDVTFGEDACQVKTAAAPQVLALFRNVAIGALNLAQIANKAAACRRYAAHALEALKLLS